MNKLKISPEELERESLRFHALNQERSKDAIAAVAEMSKHPLSVEQAREQVRQHRAEANRIERRESK